jgi:hypothetical protein
MVFYMYLTSYIVNFNPFNGLMSGPSSQVRKLEGVKVRMNND